MEDAVFIWRSTIRNYKSIARCSIKLGPLTFLVGPNGAGKSNFLDAFRFVADALNSSLENALRERGGIGEVRRRSAGHPTHFSILLEFALSNEQKGKYGFQVGALKKGGFQVQQELCEITNDSQEKNAFYKIQEGRVLENSESVYPPAIKDRLYLVAAAGLPPFRGLFDALSRMGFYNFNPDAIRELQSPDPGHVLRRDGSNLASVLNLMEKEAPNLFSRVVSYLGRVTPGVDSVTTKQLGKKETIEFRQRVVQDAPPWRFMSENMSDGTLRALGVLTSLFQSSNATDNKVPLVGIEEPEVAVHPGAAGVLRDALFSASKTTQVIVTSHSPDILDDKDISPDSILGVECINGQTLISPIDEASCSLLRDRLFTAGELMRINQLHPEPSQIEQGEEGQLDRDISQLLSALKEH